VGKTIAEMVVGILWVGAIAGGICPWAFGQTPTGSSDVPKAQTVAITVKDPSGAAVARAQVRVAPVPEKLPEKMETNDKGELTLQLKPGGYGMVVMMPGFATYKSHLEVTENGGAQNVAVVLTIGPTGSPAVILEKPDPNALTLSVAPFDENFRITREELKAFARKTVVVHNPHSNADETYKGVELADLLAKYGAPLGKDLRGAALASYVLATGADGYRVVYSLAEVDPSFHPGDVIVADTMDGKPLDAHAGPFRLVSTEDNRPARGVRNLVSVEVK
jgi:hypothetical protein